MLDQQIESASSKLVHFLEDLTLNIQTVCGNQTHFNQSFADLLQLRSDYAKQLASLFDMLLRRLIEEFLPNRTLQLAIRLDPVQLWRCVQNCIDQLNELQRQDLGAIIKHVRAINNYFYNVLLQVKNAEFLKVDQTRSLSQSLTDELCHLAESLICFFTVSYVQTPKCNLGMDTYLFQNASTGHYSSNNNHLPTNETSTPPLDANSNACPQQSYWSSPPRTCYYRPAPVRCTMTGVSSCQKPMGCGLSAQKNETPPPLCFPTPVVYTPEMETLSSSGGIIYARKSGNTWIAENLGTLIETLKDIGQTIDMSAHCEILVRKTGELFVRRKRGRRKHVIQQNLTREQSDSNISNGEPKMRTDK